MNTQELPKHIGGYQHLAPDVIAKADDIFVRSGEVRGFVAEYEGQAVAALELEFRTWNIYRRIPVAKQGDIDNTGWKAVSAGGYEGLHPEMSVAETTLAVSAGLGRAPAALPTDAKARKQIPIYSGFIKYFPLAIAEVARVSQAGNEQHNPGKPLHWDRSKSGDELDALSRHLMQAGTIDSDGQRHTAKLVWRACAALQKELEAEAAKE